MTTNPVLGSSPLDRRRFFKIGGTTALLTALTACGSTSTTTSASTSGASAAPGPSGTSAGSGEDGEKYGTAANPITISFWGWGSEKDTAMLAAYKKLHPYVTVTTSELGSTTALYTKLATVYKAGTGAPDCTALELPMMPTYAAGGYLADLSTYGANVSQFDTSAAQAAAFDGKLYAVPTDYGPMVMYYRKDIFDQYKLSVPTTWDDYHTTATALKKAAPKAFMTYMDPGDSTPTLGLIWQAGGHPFAQDGAKLTINLKDAGSAKYATYWSNLLNEGLVNPTPGFTSDWFNQLGGGTYATWFAGAWGSSVLAQSVPQSAGKWRAAELPSWEAGKLTNGAMGGSGTAVSASSPNKAAAATFAQWYGSEWPLANVGKASGATFPASLTVQKDPAYANAPSDVLGGQLAAQLYIKLSSEVVKGWQFLPYQLYANNIWKDTAGQQVAAGFDLAAGLAQWQDQLITYGTQQGFTVNS